MRPGFRGWEAEENHVWLEINSDGLRDREHPVAKPPGTLRAAVLGDSYMEAVNVPREKMFTTVLTQHLTQCVTAGGRQPEVVNFGVSGYSTAQELQTYRHHAVRYRPDIVLLAVYTGNDIFDNHRDGQEAFMQDIPFFARGDGRLLIEDEQRDEPTAAPMPWYHRVRMAMTDRLVVVERVWNVYALLRSPLVAPQVPEVNRGPGVTESRIYLPPTAMVEQAWQLTEALLLELAREVKAQGSEFWIVTLSNVEQVNPDLNARRALADGLGLDSLFYPDHRIRDFAQAHGIPVVSLAEPLADYAATNHVFLNGGYNAEFPGGTGHWNETAHRLAAGLVGERLCADSRAIAALK